MKPEAKIRQVVVRFAVPVELSTDQMRRIHDVVSEVARDHQPEGQVHWLCGMGSAVVYSKSDAEFLGGGVAVDESIPDGAEPRFDDEVFEFTTAVREIYESEKETQ